MGEKEGWGGEGRGGGKGVYDRDETLLLVRCDAWYLPRDGGRLYMLYYFIDART